MHDDTGHRPVPIRYTYLHLRCFTLVHSKLLIAIELARGNDVYRDHHVF